jgi:hypothetical protein
MKFIGIFLLNFAVVLGPTVVSQADAAESSSAACALEESDMQANAALSFDDFDQKAVLIGTARALVGRGCYLDAVRANEHYLLFGKTNSDAQQRVVVFHLGQGRCQTNGGWRWVFAAAPGFRAAGGVRVGRRS